MFTVFQQLIDRLFNTRVPDEAQLLPPRALDQIRLLSNLETTTQKLLQIILMGQPELKDLL